MKVGSEFDIYFRSKDQNWTLVFEQRLKIESILSTLLSILYLGLKAFIFSSLQTKKGPPIKSIQ